VRRERHRRLLPPRLAHGLDDEEAPGRAEEVTEKTLSTCPVSTRTTLVEHCDGGHCGWFKCRNKDCESLLDFRRKRGVKPGAGGKSEAFGLEGL
jgi:hypothetical protein